MRPVLIATASNLVAVVSGVWLGEHVGGPYGLLLGVVVACSLAFISARTLWRTSSAGALAMAMMTLVVFALPWAAGASESTLAFNECETHGERVREALARYRDKHHEFPARLSDLSMHLPGELIFPPHFLKYERTSTGYTLSFSDWLVTHEASDQRAFLANK